MNKKQAVKTVKFHHDEQCTQHQVGAKCKERQSDYLLNATNMHGLRDMQQKRREA